MNEDIQMVPIDKLHFAKRADMLPPELIDRVMLIHHAFRNYLSATLEQTIDNFKYDKNPEDEIKVWEHMANVVIALKYQENWPDEKITQAVKVILGLSMGAIQGNQLSEDETQRVTEIWLDRNPR